MYLINISGDTQECKINLVSYGYDDRPLNLSFLKINGEKVSENRVGNGRGFRLARINNECSVNETLQFDTHIHQESDDGSFCFFYPSKPTKKYEKFLESLMMNIQEV